MANYGDDLHVFMFPFFAFGHISPFVQLSNRLITRPGVKVTFFSAPGNVPRIKSTLKLDPGCDIVSISLPHVDGLPPNTESTADLPPSSAELLKTALDLMQPDIEFLLKKLKPDFIFFDFAQPWIPKMATNLGIKSLYFSVFAAIPGAYVMVPARINPSDKKYPTVSDLVKPPAGFPEDSSISLHVFEAKNYMYVFKSFNGLPCVYDRIMSGYNDCTGIVLKTCYDMEGPYIDYVKSQLQKPVLLTGPLVSKPTGEDKLDAKWGNWLEKFPAKSVIYCSFGSETFLTKDQIKELALGLELTGLPFFLVLNFPNAESDGLGNVLPEGFADRVKDRGVVHTGWVQQQLILAHENVGCFVCHSGLSSVIEALVNDCQLVLLPFKGDQFLNAKLVSRDLKCGVEVKRREEDGVFGKEDVKEAVNAVMSEKESSGAIRENHKKWREFLLDDVVQDQFVSELVQNLKAMA